MGGNAAQGELAEAALEALGLVARGTSNRPALASFHNLCRDGAGRLLTAIRVAVVGRIKAGKSTAVNALLGEEVVPVDGKVASYNVVWFEHGPSRSLTVRWRDGRSNPRPWADLDRLARSRPEAAAELELVDALEATHPCPALRDLALADTPGTQSPDGHDSANTARFVGRCTDLTQREVRRADAVLFLFHHSPGESDHKLVEEVVGPMDRHATPLNAVGVLTMVDQYWSPLAPDGCPLAAARRLIEGHTGQPLPGLRDRPAVRRTMFTVLPLANQLALGAQLLTAEDADAVGRLATAPPPRLAGWLRSATAFETADDPAIPVPTADRLRLNRRLGRYGVWYACRRWRVGVTGRDALSADLMHHSGLPALRDLLVTHFRNRALLIKLDHLLRELAAAESALRSGLSGRDAALLGEAAGRIERLWAGQHALRELGVLRTHYEGKLELDSDEVKWLLEVTGEDGGRPDERLGMRGAAPDKLQATCLERISHWRRAEIDAGAGVATAQAAAVVVRSYELVYSELLRAGGGGTTGAGP